MKFFSLSLIFFLSVAVHMQGQQKSTLSQSVVRKIAMADKKIAKGDAVVSKKEKYIRQIEAIEAQGKSSSGKMKRLQTKSNKIVVSSASFYKEGYEKKYNTYKKVVSGGVKGGTLQQDAVSIMNKAKGEYKSGRKLRRKLNNQSDVNRAADMLLDANKVEANAIGTLIKATDTFLQKEIESEPTAEELESRMDSTDIVVEAVVPAPDSELALADSAGIAQMDVITQPDALLGADSTLVPALLLPALTQDSSIMSIDSIMTNMAVEPLVEDAVLIASKAEESPQVYFSVQFLADKNAVSKDRLMKIYDGPFEVLEHVADGWYRYSFGKFPSVNEAKEMKTRSGVQGYVVAYLNKERITIKEASDMLKE